MRQSATLLDMEIGRRLKAYRDSHDLSHQQAAARAGVSASLWTNYERGYSYAPDGRKMDTNYTERSVGKIARSLGWPLEDAFEWAELKGAGGDPAERAEPAPNAQDPRDEITEILPRLSDSRALALLHVAWSMLDAEARIPGSTAAVYTGKRTLIREGPGVREPSAEERARQPDGDESPSQPNGPHPT